jgi:hypothetical protein
MGFTCDVCRENKGFEWRIDPKTHETFEHCKHCNAKDSKRFIDEDLLRFRLMDALEWDGNVGPGDGAA